MNKIITFFHLYQRLVDQLGKSFSKLFFLQIATSSLSICGSTYSLAFVSDGDGGGSRDGVQWKMCLTLQNIVEL